MLWRWPSSLPSFSYALAVVLAVLAAGTAGAQSTSEAGQADPNRADVVLSRPGAAVDAQGGSGSGAQVQWALAIHGGAGVIPKTMAEPEKREYFKALEDALKLGRQVLADGGTSLDAVEKVVRFLEDDPKFNAGKGAVFTHEGTHELDAAIMDGRTLACGSVAALKTVKNPVSLARLVMERSPHVFMVGDGAEKFADQMKVERVDQKYFFVQRRWNQLQEELAKEKEKEKDGQKPQGRKNAANPAAGSAVAAGVASASVASADSAAGLEHKYGTVGAVALDRHGNLAAATSTGGTTNKRFGRLGDVPVIGAGTYANNRTCAISATGKGEEFIKHTVAHDISSLMEYGGLTLQQAADKVIHEKLQPEDGGMIGVAHDGSIALVFNSVGMFRGAANSNGRFEVKIWE